MAFSETQDRTLVVSNNYLLWLAGELTAEWLDLGRQLGLSDAKLYEIRADNIRHEKEAKYQMLICWKQANGQQASHNSLAEALKEVNRIDLLEKVQQVHDSTYTTPLTEERLSSNKTYSWIIADAVLVVFLTLLLSYLALIPDEDIYRIIFNISILLVVLIILLACRFLIVKERDMMQQRTDSEENIPIVSTRDPEGLTAVTSPALSASKRAFINQLKEKYRDQYDAVQPIPYIKDRFYCVDRVFVEGGFKKLISKSKIEGFGNWEKLNSYHEVLKSSSSSTRIIIEGDPGYGKSTLTLQLAYDWCNHTSESPLANVEIFILLRLRQLGGVLSIFKAIKQFILPRDSALSETDIENVMYISKSTVIILDGYDEYPEEDTKSITDVISIIRREMFQENLVILTTRSSLLPKSYPPQTQRVRLTGFDEKARDAYIRKAVAGDDEAVVEKIKVGLQKNPVLQGLCQVPLFFVMFAHMTHESETFLEFDSVTSFFRYMITCFHRHLENKQKDTNVSQITFREDQHAVLDRVAFKGLSGKNQKIVWEKSKLCERLGIEFYDQYKRIGILVEEEVLDLKSKPGDIQYKIELRFYHKLFCEWYAANWLSRKVMQPGVNLQKLLKHMNPFDLQYTYRFTCGLNPDAGEKIIEYLKGIKDGDKFAVLCILEQTGKIDQIKDTIRDMCSNYITIDNNDSMLLQGSIVQLLEIGAGNQMPISFVWLKDCFNSVYLSTGSILLKSKLSIPVLPTIHELAIGERERKLDNMEVSSVLQYASRCTGLKILRFCHLLLPQSVQARCLTSLQSRKVQVLWITDDNELCLNLGSGIWQEIDGGFYEQTQEFNTQAKKNLLISFMREYYKELTSVVRPIPTNQESVYSVDQVFVDPGIEGFTHTDENSAGRWEQIVSYQQIFSDSRFIGKRRSLEGKPGFGKSTIALQLAFDWCNDSTKSTISNSEMFFLVRLKQSRFVKSIYTQLKHSALPKACLLGGNDIRQILRACPSALIVLDDFNCYTDYINDENSDVVKTIQGKMLGNIDVIITSTGMPKQCVRGTKYLRLTGFNDKTRNDYIQKAVVADELEAAEKVKRALRDNSMIINFCRIPFFFVFFAHKTHENKQFKTSSDDKELSEFILECFHCHFINQTTDNDVGLSALEKNNVALGKFALEGLCGSYQRLGQSKEKVIEDIGQNDYDYYVHMGLLVEHKVLDDTDGGCNLQGRKTESKVQVKFYNNYIVHWYASYHMAKGRVEWSSSEWKNAVESSSYLQNLCQLANNCGEFSLVWILDQGTRISVMLSIVKQLCSNLVKFYSNQTEILQKSMVHLLEVAANNKISISCVYLINCYSTVYLSGGYHLQLKSHLCIPVLTTLNRLVIREEGREITDDFTNILQYSSKCLALKVLKFEWCLLPQSVHAGSVSILRSRNVKVSWYPRGCSSSYYFLNLLSGLWEREYDDRVMTDEDYQSVVKSRRSWRRT